MLMKQKSTIASATPRDARMSKQTPPLGVAGAATRSPLNEPTLAALLFRQIRAEEAFGLIARAIDPAFASDAVWAELMALAKPREEELVFGGMMLALASSVAAESLAGSIASAFSSEPEASSVAAARWSATIGSERWRRLAADPQKGEPRGLVMNAQELLSDWTARLFGHLTPGQKAEAAKTALIDEACHFFEDYAKKIARHGGSEWKLLPLCQLVAHAQRNGVLSPDGVERLAAAFMRGADMDGKHSATRDERGGFKKALSAHEALAVGGLGCALIARVRRGVGAEISPSEWAAALHNEERAIRLRELIAAGEAPTDLPAKMLALRSLKGIARAFFEREAIAAGAAKGLASAPGVASVDGAPAARNAPKRRL
jgi:hypothetical protein